MTDTEQTIYNSICEWIGFAVGVNSVAIPKRSWFSYIERDFKDTYTQDQIRIAVRGLVNTGVILQGNTIHRTDWMNKPLYYEDGRKVMDCELLLPPDVIQAMENKELKKRRPKDGKGTTTTTNDKATGV